MDTVDFLRSIRTAAYRLASPAERLFRHLAGHPRLPPLWLRRHAGPPSAFLSAAMETAAWIERLELIAPTSRVLDIGCGCGSMVPEFARRLGDEGRYLGFDVHRASIEWCRYAFVDDRRLRFEIAEIATPYSRRGRSPATAEYRFPADDATIDLALAKSVFTHLLAVDAGHYLHEIRRVLRPTGRALVTFFLFEDLDPVPPAFPFPRSAGNAVRWRLNRRPEAAVAYWKREALDLIAAAGLEVRTLIPGFWPGRVAQPTGQDQLVLGLARGG